MKTCYLGIGEVVATFNLDGNGEIGDFVKMSGNGTVAVCSQTDNPIGKISSKSGDVVGIQLKGYMEGKISGTGHTLGHLKISAAAGSVAVSANGTPVLVVYKDADKIGFFI